ncbi:MAG: PIN domain-containing protein [Deltaproteobacteria bacterium]|nr:PIN domain-containing protein [Deltaproteobacteria bacterium]
MRILFDTNVVLDVLLDRHPHAVVAAELFVHVERKRVDGLLGATTVTTVHYLATKAVGTARARSHLRTLLSIFDVAPIDGDVLADALALGFADFEDAVLHEAARHAGATGIVTRDPKGFAGARLSVYPPDELLRMVRLLPGR